MRSCATHRYLMLFWGLCNAFYQFMPTILICQTLSIEIFLLISSVLCPYWLSWSVCWKQWPKCLACHAVKEFGAALQMAVVTLSLLAWNNEFEQYCAGMLVCMCLPSKTPMPWPADHRRECTEGHRQASRQFQAIYCWRATPLQPLQSTVSTTRHTVRPAYWCRYREPEAVHTAQSKKIAIRPLNRP